MSNWSIKSLDQMKITQDTATNPPSASHIDTVSLKAKEAGATHLAISVPYDLPNGGGDVTSQTDAWVKAGVTHGLNIWHRHSWCSDQGFYGVAKDNKNDRIQDTVQWIKAHQGFFKDGDIFTPKPEPQNCGINGVNTGSDYRFSSAAQFNQWLRDMQKACEDTFTSLGIKVKVGYFGFDGFIVCGYGNPDWQGKSFLENATVQALGNVLAVDHYPELVGKPMTDFLSVFKKVWPGVEYIAGEWGAVGSGDPLTQIQNTMGALAADPIVTGVNYWVESDNKTGTLLDGNLNITPLYTAVQTFFQGAGTPPPVPVPTPTPNPTPAPIPASEGTRLGNMDLGSYCTNIQDGTAKLDTAGVWHCTGDNKNIDLNAACQFQYKDKNAYAKQERAGDPYSYACYAPKGAATPPTSTPVPPSQTVINITGTVTITTDNAGKTSLKITATG